MFAAILARVLAQFIPMRMNKSGNQSITANSSNVQIQNWTADGSYPGTVITSHRLVVKAGSATVTAALQFSTTVGYTTQGMIWKNGVQIGTTKSSTAASGTLLFNDIPMQNFNDNDTVEMRITISLAPASVVAAGTYIRVE